MEIDVDIKRLVVYFVLSLAAISSFAQPCTWSSDQTGKIVETCGQVGIGTTTPASGTMLHVNASTTGPAVLISGNATGVQISQTAGQSSYLLSAAGYDTSYNGVLLSMNANLNGTQLNTQLPAWAFDLGGGFDSFGAKLTDAFTLKRLAPGSTSWQNFLTVNSAGRLGVGTGAPDAAIAVDTSNSTGAPQIHLNGNPGGLRLSQNGASGSAYILTTAGYDVNYNGLLMSVNAGFNGTQLNTAVSSWAADLGGGFDSFGTKLTDAFTLKRHAANSGAWVNLFALDASGNLTVAGNITGARVINAVYQDVAEWVPATTKMGPGTVVVLNPDRNNEVMPSEAEYDTRVAGVVSAAPGVLLGTASDSKAMIATTGRVRVRVDATKRPVRIGDLLVTSDTSGTAMVSEPMEINGRKFHQPGTVIGKALEPLTGGRGEILVLLSLQ